MLNTLDMKSQCFGGGAGVADVIATSGVCVFSLELIFFPVKSGDDIL